MRTPTPEHLARMMPRVALAIAAAASLIVVAPSCAESGGVLLDDGSPRDAGPDDAGVGDDGGPNDAGFPDDAGVIVDEAGDDDDPLDVEPPFTTTFALDPAGDVDCFRFVLTEPSVVTTRVFAAGAANETCDDEHDTALTLDRDATGALAFNDDEAPDSRCPSLDLTVPAGAHVLCVEHFLADLPLVVRGLEIEIDVEATPLCGDAAVGAGEDCDDGNDVTGDGCAACAFEPGFTCPATGGACVPIVAIDAADRCGADLPTFAAPAEGDVLALYLGLVGLVDDTQPSCLSIENGADGVFALTASENGKLAVRSRDEGIITALTLFDACAGAELDCDSGLGPRVERTVGAGDVVIVVADFFNEFASEDRMRLDVTFLAEPTDAPRDAGPADDAGQDAGPAEASCLDNVDNDGDDRVDCADDECDGDARCGLHATIQDVQNGTIPAGTRVTIVDAYVTARRTAGGSSTLFLQEPDGETNGAAYPDFAGLILFVAAAAAPSVPELGAAQIGACVSTSGVVSEFNGTTQLITPTFLSVSTACAPAAAPVSVAMLDVATDAVDLIAGDQAGPRTENLEGVLLLIPNVDVASVGIGQFTLTTPAFPGATLLVTDFMSAGPLLVAPGEHLTTVTGVLTQFSSFRLQPRSDTDIVR